MGARRRVLVVSNTPFLPASAGNRARIGRIVEYLGARGWDVGMVLLSDWGVETWDMEGMRRHLAFLDLAAPSRSFAARLGRAAGRLLRPRADGRPLSVDEWCPAWFARRVRRAVRAWRPEVVLVVYVSLSRVLDALPKGPLRVIDAQDVMHRREAAYRRAGATPRWFHTTREEERRGLARADVILAISDDDARAFAALLPGARILTVPHGEPLRPAPLEAARPDRLLCVASDNDLNVDGLRWFLAEVWPLVRAGRPAELVVCGGVCDKIGAAPDGVVLRGFVPVLDEEYARARLVISPLRGGTGMKVKVAAALAYGRPVVATPAGAEGIPADAGLAVAVADRPRSVGDAIVRLLVDDDHWRRAALAAVAYARGHLAPAVALEPLGACLETIGVPVRAGQCSRPSESRPPS